MILYLMSSKFSYMDSITQYFQKMRDRIQALELENSNLKKYQNSELDELKKEFANLSERHKELKEAFLESENQVKELTHEKELILQKEKEFSELMKSQFEEKSDDQKFLTPKKPTSDIKNESQKMKYLKAKKVPIKLDLKSMYESDSDSDDVKVNFNFQENNSEEESMDVMKKLIGNDLWNCMDSSVNSGQQQYQEKSSQTIINQNGLYDAYTYLETHGKTVDFLRSQEERYNTKIDNDGLFGKYLATHGDNVDFFRSQIGGKK